MNKFVIQFLKVLAALSWYVLLPLLVILGIIVAISSLTGHPIEWDVPVYIHQSGEHLQLPASLLDSRTISLNKVEGVLKIKVQLSALLMANMMSFLGLSIFLFAGITYHARRLLQTLSANTPFTAENYLRLRYISIFIIAATLIEFINGLFNYALFSEQLKAAGDVYRVKVSVGFLPLLIGLVIFLLAEIFRKGNQLKTENESII